MTGFITTWLFGSAQPDPHNLRSRRFIRSTAWLFVVVAIATLRLLMPFHNDSSDFSNRESIKIYNAMTIAIATDQNWGKQAIAGVVEYPPLPTFVLLLAHPLESLREQGWPLPIMAHLIMALAQALVLIILIETAWKGFGKRMGTVIGLLLFTLLWLLMSVSGGNDFQKHLWAETPYWVCAVPLAALFKHVVEWESTGKTRNLIWAAILCGVLVFCGIAGIITALCVLPLLLNGREHEKPEGYAWLVLLPFAYALVIHFLFNQLIMADWLFSWRRFMDFYMAGQQQIPVQIQPWMWISLSASLCIAGSFLPKLSFCARLGWHLLLAFCMLYVLQTNGSIFIGGASILGAMAILPVIFQAAMVPKQKHRGVHAIAAMLGIVLVIGATGLNSGRRDQHEKSVGAAPPTRDELTDYVDQHWQDSRILIYGLHAAVAFAPDPRASKKERERFVARLDFHPQVLIDAIAKEQLHLLVPPDNGRYYARNHKVFSDLQHDGIPDWVLLERTWPTTAAEGEAWQLWRCVRPEQQDGH